MLKSKSKSENSKINKNTLKPETLSQWAPDERGKREFNCNKQVERAVIAPNCILKGSWGEGESGGIRKKLKG